METTRPKPDGVNAFRSLDYFVECFKCKNQINVGDIQQVNHFIKFRRWITCEHCKAILSIVSIKPDREKFQLY